MGPSTTTEPAGGVGGIVGGGMPPPVPTTQSNAGLLGDIFGVSSAPSVVSNPKVQVLNATSGKGMEMSVSLNRRSGQIYMDLTFTNKAMAGISGIAIQLNKNRYVSIVVGTNKLQC